jgi:predicted DNA-binding transcriptional regulator AlpA
MRKISDQLTNRQATNIEDALAAAIAPRMLPLLLDPFVEAVRIVLKKELDDVVRMPDDPPDEFMALAEVAAMLKTHKTTCLRWEANGELPKRRWLGGKSGWLRSEIVEHLKTLPHNTPVPESRLSGPLVSTCEMGRRGKTTA